MKNLYLTIVNIAWFYEEIHLKSFLEVNYGSVFKRIVNSYLD